MSNDRIASFLNAAGDGELGLPEGSVYGFCRKFAEASGTSIWHLEEKLLILLHHDHYRNPEETKYGNDWEYKKVIYGHTGYILAGTIPVNPAGRLNCYVQAE